MLLYITIILPCNLTATPIRLEDLLAGSHPATVFIDEIQRLPSLLNTIQTLIDEIHSPPIFYMTGSSARKQ